MCCGADPGPAFRRLPGTSPRSQAAPTPLHTAQVCDDDLAQALATVTRLVSLGLVVSGPQARVNTAPKGLATGGTWLHATTDQSPRTRGRHLCHPSARHPIKRRLRAGDLHDCGARRRTTTCGDLCGSPALSIPPSPTPSSVRLAAMAVYPYAVLTRPCLDQRVSGGRGSCRCCEAGRARL